MLGLNDDVYNAQSAKLMGSLMAGQAVYATPTMTERLDSRIAETETRLKELTELKELIKSVPNLERILTLLQKGVY